MRPRILISAPYAMPVIQRYRFELERAGCEIVVASVRERLEEAQLLELVPTIDGIICGDDRITERVLAAASRLKVISKWGTGIDSIDVDAAAKRGIPVRNTPNAFSEPVADTVLGYLLLHARKAIQMDTAIRKGEWIKPQLVAVRELTLGVIGVGNCGKAVVRRAIGFGARILGNDVVEMPEGFLESVPIEMTSFEDLLRRSDVVSVHTTLNPTSAHLLNEAAFSLLKSGAFVINTARGPIIDQSALIRALESGKISGAALDVFEDEPLPLDSPLRRFPNCWMAPHNANSSPEAVERVHRNTIAQLLEVLGGHFPNLIRA
ncbi:MAG: phosphoglycerate dehydrogenase [Gemmatimonadota bacterium]|nr:phosphoglycerate dehydrogenase [Gemmatimonadota bacterium]